MFESVKKFQYASLSEVMTPANMAIWDSMSIGVAVVDAAGLCVYMNPLQRKMDGFTDIDPIGRHITELYLPNNMERIPTMECLRLGVPILHKSYAYKTAQNRSLSSVEDFFPLFERGRKDGVLAFCIWGGEGTRAKDAAPLPAARPFVAETSTRYSFDSIVGQSPVLLSAIDDAKAAAKSSAPVMIWGESGTGKELFAQAIHSAGARGRQPFVAVNCAAIPEPLLEGILFGTVKGAYTDAADKPGLFEQASGGTLLLDELNSMPLGLQAKLLRVLQEKRIRRVGSQAEKKVDVRVISILNEAPMTAIERGTLRKDLYYRLAVVGISIPPLRERLDDIPLLTASFLRQQNPHVAVDDDVMELFRRCRWGGNVRELLHVLEGSLALLDGRTVIGLDCLPRQFYESCRDSAAAEEAAAPLCALPGVDDYRNVRRNSVMPLKERLNAFEAHCICSVLRVTGGNVAKAARIMDITAPGLRYKMKQLGIGEDDY